MDEERLTDLETKFSHQEKALDELQNALYDQALTIEKLEKALKLLKERFDGETSGANQIAGNEKPPHY